MNQLFKQLLTVTLLSCGVTALAQRGTVSGTISDDKGEPLTGVFIEVLNTRSGTVSELDGSYELSLDPGNYTLKFTFLGYSTATNAVAITSGKAVTLNVNMTEDMLGLDEVIIVGTRTNDRTVTNSTAPVDVIGSRELRANGATQTIQALQMLVPSYNVTKPSITDGSDHFRPATLRGLGPDQVLVLINGKRRHTSALVHVNGTIGRGSTGVDMNAIPASAIERIEVLRDGAAAQYGSDAIAGVINIILKKGTGFDVEATYGSHLTTMERGYAPDEGLYDGITNQAIRENGTLFSYDWLDKPEDVKYTDGQRLNLHLGKGFKIGQNGSLYVSGQFRKQGRTNRQGSDVRINYFTQANGEFDPREASFDRDDNFRYGDAEFLDYSLFLNGDMKAGERSTFYVFGGASYRDGVSGCFYRRARDSRTVRSIYPDGFLPRINARITDLSLGAGLKGTLGENWNFDLSQVVGKDAFALYMENTHNTSLGGLGQFTFPDPEIRQQTEMYDGTLNFTQATTNFDLTRNFEAGLAAPLSLAIGSEIRYEKYDIEPGEVSSYYDGNAVSGGVQDGPSQGNRAAAGCQCFPGWKDDVSDNRQSFAIYSELETQPVENWTTAVAGRFEYYTDFGPTVNGKVATRLQIAQGLAFRGALSTGFRAPSLGQANYSAIQTTAFGTTLIETGFFPVNTKIAKALGAKDLDPEKSVNLSGGITFSAINFALTVDAYQINIKDRIILSEQFVGKTGPNGEDLLEQYLISQGLSAAQGVYFTNALDTKTQGIDITSRYATGLGQGRLKLTLSANFNKTEVTNEGEITTPEELKQYSDTPLMSELELNRIQKANPRNVFNFIINYDVSKFTSMLRFVRFGEMTWGDWNDFGNIVYQDFSPKIVTDLELGYKITDGLSVFVGSNNLLDVYPDKYRKDLAFNGIFQYDGTNPVGFNGRYVYARLAYSLGK